MLLAGLMHEVMAVVAMTINAAKYTIFFITTGIRGE
jgi:hypothetical protein